MQPRHISVRFFCAIVNTFHINLKNGEIPHAFNCYRWNRIWCNFSGYSAVKRDISDFVMLERRSFAGGNLGYKTATPGAAVRCAISLIQYSGRTLCLVAFIRQAERTSRLHTKPYCKVSPVRAHHIKRSSPLLRKWAVSIGK